MSCHDYLICDAECHVICEFWFITFFLIIIPLLLELEYPKKARFN